MKTTKSQPFHPILSGALRGFGALLIVGIGTIGFNLLGPETPTEAMHNASEVIEEFEKAELERIEQIEGLGTQIETINEEKSALQENLAQLQTQLIEIQTNTTIEEAILALKAEIAILQSGQQTLEEGFSAMIPLGSMIATNGSVAKSDMNALGWALADGTSIASQVPDAVLQGNTLNLAGRSLIGAGMYAKDNSISFTLGHVDEYKIGNRMFPAEVLHTLSIEEIPEHSHGVKMQVQNGGSDQRVGLPIDKSNTKDVQGGIQTETAGAGQPHNNMSPFHVVNYYIKVK